MLAAFFILGFAGLAFTILELDRLYERRQAERAARLDLLDFEPSTGWTVRTVTPEPVLYDREALWPDL